MVLQVNKTTHKMHTNSAVNGLRLGVKCMILSGKEGKEYGDRKPNCLFECSGD